MVFKMKEKILAYNPGTGLGEEEVDSNYRKDLSKAKNILIKTGSDVLLKGGKLDRETTHNLLEQEVELVRGGKRVTHLTSGAKAAGKAYVGEERAQKMSARALCTAGQSILMQAYLEIMSTWPDVIIGQGLLEDKDFQDKYRKSTKGGFDEFPQKGIVIVNANDFAWTGETKYDNDALGANLYKLLKADLAIYLTDVDGLISEFGTENERLVNHVYGINSKIYDLMADKKSKSGIGGIETKLRKGMKKILDFNGRAVIANGKRKNVILDILNGEEIGTLFG